MREIKGRDVLVFTVGAFGIIIAVNLVMAYKAVSTFPGLEVKNSYVASQGFDQRRAEQQALGWTMVHDYDAAAGRLTLRFTDATGKPVEVAGMNLLVGRTTAAADDQNPEALPVGDVYEAKVALNPGRWMLKVQALAEDGTLFEQRVDFMVRG
jgi:nitrogen fixation protein FixH